MNGTRIGRFDGLNGFDEAVMMSVGILGKTAYGLRIASCSSHKQGRQYPLRKFMWLFSNCNAKGFGF